VKENSSETSGGSLALCLWSIFLISCSSDSALYLSVKYYAHGKPSYFPDGRTVYTDLAKEDTLFTGEGDYQFDIYRKMKEHNR